MFLQDVMAKNPITQWHGWLRELSSILKKCFLGHPSADDQVYEIKDEGKITYKGLGGVYLRILNG